MSTQLNYQNNEQEILKSQGKVRVTDLLSRLNEEKKIDDLLKLRRSNQPLNWPTAGSTFRNPEQNFAAKLIEEVGLKGFQIGDARISNKHANFIENVGDATAKDIEQLIYHAQDKVEELKKIRLQLEVKIIGENVD